MADYVAANGPGSQYVLFDRVPGAGVLVGMAVLVDQGNDSAQSICDRNGDPILTKEQVSALVSAAPATDASMLQSIALWQR